MVEKKYPLSIVASHALFVVVENLSAERYQASAEVEEKALPWF